MSTRLTLSASTSLDAFADTLDNMASIVDMVGRDVYADYAEPIKQALSQEPGPVKTPIVWTSKKQQRAFFATNGFGRGIGAPRTHELSQGWEVIFVEEAGSFRILITNPSPASKFVYGSLAKNPTAANRFKQQFHTNTGWISASPIVQNYIEAMATDFKFRLQQAVSDISVTGVRSRAFTGR